MRVSASKWFPVTVAVLVAVATAPAVAAAPALATAGGSGPAGTTTFYVDGMTVTTSRGLRVLFYLQTDENDHNMDIFGWRPAAGGFETHDWTFYAPHHAFASYNRTSGSGSVDATVNNLADFGSVHLTFAQTGGWTTRQCDVGSTSSAPLTFRGTFFFRTMSGGRHPWGHAGTATHPVAFASKGTAVRFNGCTDQPPFRCSPGTVWQRGPLLGQPMVLADHRVPTIDATRYHPRVGGSSRVQRLDDVLAQVSKPQASRDARGLHVKITPLPHTRVHGTATLSASQPAATSTRSCLPAPNTETQRTWASVAYRNGTHPLTIRFDMGADIQVADADDATLSRTHVN